MSTLKPAKMSSERLSTGEALETEPRLEAQKASKKSGCLRSLKHVSLNSTQPTLKTSKDVIQSHLDRM